MWTRVGTIVFTPAGTAFDVYFLSSPSRIDGAKESETALKEVREAIADSGVAGLDRRFRLVPASGRTPDTGDW